jgi:Tol biopolymer transport system component
MLAIGLLCSPAAQAAYPGANGRIAWQGVPTGSGTDSEIVSANADGTGVTALTSNSVDDIDPAWSPDGKKIAFARANGAIYEIWTMNADGSGQTLVVQQSKSVTHPTWSPAQNKLVFQYAFSATDDDIWAADASGLNAGIVQLAVTTINERDPAWEPGGSRIAFVKFNSSSGNWDIMFMTYPSGPVTPFLSGAAASYGEPAWSPDATKLAFQNGVSGINDAIGRINSDGTGYVGFLPGGPTGDNDHNPAWSPEGQLITWDWENGTDTEIRMQRFDGSLGSWITNPGDDVNPDWQPVTTAQVRPLGASPMYLPLTVAFDDCGAGPTHDPPINSPTCGPAEASSPDLTFGEPQVNGKPAKGNGFISIKTQSPSNGEVKVSIKDVRCKNYFGGCNTLLGDYSDFVRLGLQFQITDRATAAGTAATVPILVLTTNVPCTATADTTVGSTCQVTTDINSILPGAIVPNKRASWVLLKATIYDTQSRPFLVPGNFYP